MEKVGSHRVDLTVIPYIGNPGRRMKLGVVTCDGLWPSSCRCTTTTVHDRYAVPLNIYLFNWKVTAIRK